LSLMHAVLSLSASFGHSCHQLWYLARQQQYIIWTTTLVIKQEFPLDCCITLSTNVCEISKRCPTLASSWWIHRHW
jgi:hypothetical protein